MLKNQTYKMTSLADNWVFNKLHDSNFNGIRTIKPH